ncbi:competence protein [Knoellia sinensis KCTC 19936]|uniref:Competence protein n=1 Tax=Knoellia sinensis KCTC 19936 TaxID=1385520 RepID=A0A0A0JGE4_9MICO|nr:CinA family protein [Knoellia sinensis]KGN34681.1 competence protein [Knoellia sinensis KCTC 19936]
MTDPAEVVASLIARGLTVATAESLTGGLVSGALTSVAGSSSTVRGGVVSYATEIKADLLGVDPDRLAATGPVDGEVAAQMAVGACRLLGADVGLATTGVAGPGPSDGVPAGVVFVAAAGPWTGGVETRRLTLTGDRESIRTETVRAVLDLAAELLGGMGSSDTPGSP